MGLFESALMSACVAGSSGQAQLACQKATEAGGKQTGIAAQADAFESRETKFLEKSAVEFLGQDSVNVVAGTVFLAKTVESKSLSIGLPTLGLCSSIKAEIKESQSMLKFEWKF